MADEWISVEGIVGAGKTTLLKRFESIKATVIPEPVEKFQENGLLAKSYENPKEYAFPAQCHFFTSRINEFERRFNNEKGAINVSERSPYSDKLFADINMTDPDIKSCYLGMWKRWQDFMPKNMRNPTLFIYLRPSLETCMKRAKERGRPEDKDIDIEYQKRLMEEHDKAFGTGLALMPDGTYVPCITIATDEDVEKMLQLIHCEHSRQCESFQCAEPQSLPQ